MGEGSRGWDTFAGACSGLSGGADNLRTATALITNRHDLFGGGVGRPLWVGHTVGS